MTLTRPGTPERVAARQLGRSSDGERADGLVVGLLADQVSVLLAEARVHASLAIAAATALSLVVVVDAEHGPSCRA